jgi:transcriptional regulator with XRE-family HTH domain/tetratricopeptide (TPR) repeat protein
MGSPGPHRPHAAPSGRRRCQGCGSALAADNTARLCSSCHREERDQLRMPPTHLRDGFFETDEFRAAFESQHIGKVFRAYRNHPRHLQLFGKALNQELLGRWLGLTQAQVSKLENGKPEQNLEALRNYAEALHLPQRMLWFDFPGQSRLRPLPSARSADNEGSTATATLLASVGSMGDPGNVPLSANEVSITSGDLTEMRRRALHDSLAGGVSAASLDDWEVTAFRHAAAAKDREPSRLLVDLTTDFGELQSALTTCRSTVQLRRITRVAAQLSGLMCLTLIKLDERQAFRRWARTARLAAAEVDDPTTTAWVLAQEAYGHFYGHDLAEAVAVAQQAQDVAGRSVGSALAAALEARAHAVRGDPKQTHKALAQAEETLGFLDCGLTTDVSAFAYNEAQLRFHQSNALTHLGDTKSALVVQDRALELASPIDFMDRAFVRLDRAACLLRDGDHSGAAFFALESMLALSAEQRRGIISGRAQELLLPMLAQGHTSPAALDLRDLLKLSSREW